MAVKNEYKRNFVMLIDQKGRNIGFAKIQVSNGCSRVNISLQNVDSRNNKTMQVYLGVTKEDRQVEAGRVLLDETGRGDFYYETDLQFIDSVAVFNQEKLIAEGYVGNEHMDWSKPRKQKEIVELMETAKSMDVITVELEKIEEIVDEIIEEVKEVEEIQEELVEEEIQEELIEELIEETEEVQEEFIEETQEYQEPLIEYENEEFEEENLREMMDGDYGEEQVEQSIEEKPKFVDCSAREYINFIKMMRTLERLREEFCGEYFWFRMGRNQSYLKKDRLFNKAFIEEIRTIKINEQCRVGVYYNERGNKIERICLAFPENMISAEGADKLGCRKEKEYYLKEVNI